MTDLKTGSIGGIPLEFEDLEDSYSKAIVRYEYPNVDGVDTEDLGQGARTVRVRCWFWDDGSHQSFDNHLALLQLLESRELLDFFHPRYGLIRGRIESVSVRCDERLRCAPVDFTLVEHFRQKVEAAVALDLDSFLDAQFIQAQEDLRAYQLAYAAAHAKIPPAELSLFDQVLDATKSIADQFSGLTRQAWAYVQKVDAFEKRLNATLNQVANPANSLLSTINFATNIPGRICGALARCCERYALLFAGLRDTPTAFLNSLRDGLTVLKASCELPDQFHQAAAHRVALECGALFSTDQTNRDALKQQEQTAAFDSLGSYQSQVPSTGSRIMTVQEIEAVLALSRTMLQGSVDLSRSGTAAKEMARALLEHANSIKLERERLISVTVPNPLPLHLVCLAHGLPYRYAPRILAVNPQVDNPNRVSGTITLYARP